MFSTKLLGGYNFHFMAEICMFNEVSGHVSKHNATLTFPLTSVT